MENDWILVGDGGKGQDGKGDQISPPFLTFKYNAKTLNAQKYIGANIERVRISIM